MTETKTPGGAREVCDYCGEALGPRPVRRGSKTYCCEACAMEAQRAKDCGGRADTAHSRAAVEPADRRK